MIKDVWRHLYYARGNRINPLKPETWDNNYKKRMQKLAGILPNVKDDLKKLEGY